MIAEGRRYDIDWLRVIAIGLLLVYHVVIGFQPWGIFIRFIQSNEPLEAIWIPMSALNVWRIPLLFYVSGMGVCFAMRKRNWKQLVGERSLRILLPFVVGTLAIVPIHVAIWNNYYNQPLQYSVDPAHLWFLGFLFIYVLLSLPLFYKLKGWIGGTLQRQMTSLFGTFPGLLVVLIPFLLEAILVDPDSFEMYAMTFHGFWIGWLAFIFGFLFIYSGNAFFLLVKKWKWLFMGLALSMFFVRLLIFELKAPNALVSIESNFWIFAVFGIGFSYLNRPSKLLDYLSQAVYPVYIIHMAFLYLASWLILPTSWPVSLQLVLVIAFTTAGCFLTYELLIRRVQFIRPLFGLKRK